MGRTAESGLPARRLPAGCERDGRSWAPSVSFADLPKAQTRVSEANTGSLGGVSISVAARAARVVSANAQRTHLPGRVPAAAACTSGGRSVIQRSVGADHID